MDESERLSCIIALQHELEQQHHKGLDFLVASFAAACKCHRRASGWLLLLQMYVSLSDEF